jgi:hypothetical protein
MMKLNPSTKASKASKWKSSRPIIPRHIGRNLDRGEVIKRLSRTAAKWQTSDNGIAPILLWSSQWTVTLCIVGTFVWILRFFQAWSSSKCPSENPLGLSFSAISAVTWTDEGEDV